MATCETELNLSVSDVSNKYFTKDNSFDKPNRPIFYLEISDAKS